ncbi:efflux transporter periplasmic adaptor subunit, partial [Vibrio cholerae]|nr:efflux transporter periplasmic adaptor subunit [Vibrio cholerae]
MYTKPVSLIAGALALALTLGGCSDKAPPAAAAQPPGVPVAQVVARAVTPFVEYTGSLTAI